MKYNLIALCILSSGLVACGGSNSENSPGVLSINGNAVEDQTLTTTLTDEDGLRWATYQWSADGVIINGEISDSLLLTSEHVGAVITAHASYTDKAGNGEEINSAETNEVEALPEVNVVGTVVISGATTVGQTLTAQVTDSNGTTGTITYSWAADGSEISGATASTYILTGAELAATITVTVSYTDDNGTDESLTSAATDPVVTGLSNTSATLTIGDSGLIVVGDSVSAVLTDPDGTSAATFVWSNDMWP